ncbi:RcpC/CpaB family pilus assembly protein [Streptomyces sp. NPDC005486]|uniref:RcpC/CpaB family pilus assembly protein n=1 Tax=Streptomyces sp. NPDC005486 TaxID=3155345 RepID=UPI0033AE3044
MSDSRVPPSPPRPFPFPAPSPLPFVARPPGADAPATCEVPSFAPVRVRGGRYRLGRLVRSRRRALALGLAVTAIALVAAGPGDGAPGRGQPGEGASRADARRGAHARAQASASARQHGFRAVEKVTAPVRIADAATVRLLRPGDRVDVIAAEQTATGGVGGTGVDARVVAHGALVTKVPEPLDSTVGAADDGALVVLSVPRSTAARLAGASATARLAVTLW